MSFSKVLQLQHEKVFGPVKAFLGGVWGSAKSILFGVIKCVTIGGGLNIFLNLDGGFKYFVFSPLPVEMNQFD